MNLNCQSGEMERKMFALEMSIAMWTAIVSSGKIDGEIKPGAQFEWAEAIVEWLEK